MSYKKLSLFILLISLSFGMVYAEGGAILVDTSLNIINEDFEEYSPPKIPSGNWIVDIIKNGRAQVVSGDGNLLSLSKQTDEGVQGAFYEIPPHYYTTLKNSVYILSVSLRFSANNMFFNAPFLLDSNNNASAAVMFDEDGRIKVYSGGKTADLGKYNANETYNLKIVCDPIAKNFDLYINEKLLKSSVAYKDTGFKNLTRVYFALGGKGEMQIDNFSISTADLNTEIIDKNVVTFYDISKNHWAAAYIQTVARNGIMNGTSKNYFSPKQHLTGAQFAVILARAANLPAEDTEIWYEGSVKAAQKAGIIEQNFDPNAVLTRVSVCGYIARAYEYISGETVDMSNFIEGSFTDIDSLNAGEFESLKKAFSLNVMTGVTDTEFKPYDYVSREQTAKIMCKFIDLKK